MKTLYYFLSLLLLITALNIQSQVITKNDSDIFSFEKNRFISYDTNFLYVLKILTKNNYLEKDIYRIGQYIQNSTIPFREMPCPFYFNYLHQHTAQLMPAFINHNNSPFKLHVLGLLDLEKKTKDSLLKNPNLPITVKARLGDKKAEQQIIDAFNIAIYRTDTLYSENEIKENIMNMLYAGTEKCMQQYVKGLESTKLIVSLAPWEFDYSITPIPFVLLNWYKEVLMLEPIWPFKSIYYLWINYANSLGEYINTDKMIQQYKEAENFLNKKYNIKTKMTTKIFRKEIKKYYPTEQDMVKYLKTIQQQKK